MTAPPLKAPSLESVLYTSCHIKECRMCHSLRNEEIEICIIYKKLNLFWIEH